VGRNLIPSGLVRLHLGNMKPVKPDEMPGSKRDVNSGTDVTKQAEAEDKTWWADHVARTTVALAVMAALASGQNAGEFSSTILAQGEENDAWAYYQAKSMKSQMASNQAESLRFVAAEVPTLAASALPLAAEHEAAHVRYEKEAQERLADAKKQQGEKSLHLDRSNSLAHGFIALQAGVILATLSTNKKKMSFWILAIVLGVAGLLLFGNAYLRLLPKI
jgi:Domain of unknown function (DUF4337)